MRAHRPLTLLLAATFLLPGSWPLALAQDGDDAPRRRADDPSLGEVLDREGAGAIRRALSRRWRFAQPGAQLVVGDLVKTATRGANAMQLALVRGKDRAELLLGPGAMVELIGPGKLRLIQGEAELEAPAGVSWSVVGPDGKKLVVKGRSVLRARKTLSVLEQDPAWLRGYREHASTEAMGSLVAQVDGRDVPLTIGYHKVTVDIRDQIARTTVEQSFVNHTHSILEGVFYFPLPQDASISGFAMWIGDELVHGEVVEKQRARAIYEQILREKRDPGLLEWSGGNLFKARVYPIGAEKRIKLTYTQVLPREGDGYRYRYGLRSEHLREHPLAKLEVVVNVHSAQGIESVTVPSHPCRIRTSEHAALAELSLEEVVPERDFELRVALPRAAATGQVTCVSHVRDAQADDAYLMLLVDAPPLPDEPERNAAPLDVILIADTSASMHGPQREAQLAFLEAFLEGLGEDDGFRVLTVDSEVRQTQRTDNSADARRAALDFVEAREPMGWSDLEIAFAKAANMARAGTQVVYVGDGAFTAGDPDPNACAQRLRGLYKGQGSFHAVVPGSRAEPAVLRAIASLGGGSLRQLGDDPAQSAFDLLDEVSRPALKDLQIAFEGLEVAAVYPRELPNLPAGGQQVVLARWNPGQQPTKAVITLSGSFQGERLEQRQEIVLDPGVEGNSFLPRLWARRHLDQLLDQGSDSRVQQRVIALSEDFQIITPYTSFLVLESDEDRRRFQVEKKFRMRDGEDFFAEGLAEGNHELKRDQLQAAKGWRQSLVKQLMQQLTDMGRSLTRPVYASQAAAWGVVGGGMTSTATPVGRSLHESEGKSDFADSDGADMARDLSAATETAAADPMPAGEPMDMEADDELPMEEALERRADMPSPSVASRSERVAGKKVMRQRAQNMQGGRAGYAPGQRYAMDGFFNQQSGLLPQPSTAWDVNLFPFVPTPPQVYSPLGQPFTQPGAVRGANPAWVWTAEHRALLLATGRRAWVTQLGGGLKIETRIQHGQGELKPGGTGSSVLAPRAWLTRQVHLTHRGFRLDWWDGQQRGALDTTWELGQVRDGADGDAQAYGAPIPWCFGDSLRGLAQHTIRKTEQTPAGLRIELVSPHDAKQVVVLTLDTEKALVVSVEYYQGQTRTSAQRLSQPVQIGEVWFPTRLEYLDAEGQVTWRADYTLTPLSDAQVAAELNTIPRQRAILLGAQPATPADARQLLKQGERQVEARWVLLNHYAATQRWDLAWEQLEGLAEAAAGRDGLVALRALLATQSGRRERLRTLALEQARRLAATPHAAEDSRAQYMASWSYQFGTGEEREELLAILEPVARRQPPELDAVWNFEQLRFQALLSSNRAHEAVVVARRLLKAHPERYQVYQQLAQALIQQQRVDEGLAVWKQALSREGWTPHEVGAVRQQMAYQLFNLRRLDELAKLTESWLSDEDQVPTQLAQLQLSCLVLLDREPDAMRLVHQWLHVGDETPNPQDVQRFQAASQLLLGQGHDLYRHGQLEPEHAALLGKVVRAAVEHAELLYPVDAIMGHWAFQQSKVGRETARWILRQAAAAAPAGDLDRVARLLRWCHWAVGLAEGQEQPLPTVQDVHRALHARWKQTAAGPERDRLFVLVDGSGVAELRLALWRQALQKASTPEAKRPQAVGLFSVILQQPWTAALAEEAQGLLRQVGPRKEDAEPQGHHHQQLQAVLHLLDWTNAGQAQAALDALEDRKDLSRRQLKAARRDARRKGRQAAIGLLLELRQVLTRAEVQPWIELERVWFQVKLGADLDEARQAAAGVLEAMLLLEAEKKAEDPTRGERRLLAARALTTLIHLAASGEDAEATDALLELCREQLAAKGDLLDWRKAQYLILITAGRIEPLRALLTEWLAGEETTVEQRWGRVLAYLQAELDQLVEAAATFERLAAKDALGHGDLTTLATWYTALDQAEQSADAQRRSWDMLDEWQLANQLQQALNAASRQGEGVPEELGPEVQPKLQVLLRKTAYPANHMWLVAQLYRTTRDFRVLSCLPEGVMGRTAQEIYPALNNVRDVINSIQEEAALDQLIAHLQALRGRAESDVDRRALHLLESQCARKGASQTQGAGPHARRALASLQAAFKGSWEDGEPQRLAEYLRDLQDLHQPALQAERLRQLRALRELEPVDSAARLAISDALARVLWRESQQDQAIEVLQAALNAFRAGLKQKWLPTLAHGSLSTLAGYLMDRGRYVEAEALFLAEIAAGPPPQALWSHEYQLHQLYVRALSHGARTSLGQGAALYDKARLRILAWLEQRSDENRTNQSINSLVHLFQVAKQKRIEVREHLSSFAFQVLPKVLALYQYRNGQNAVGTVCDALRDLVDPATALSFLLTRGENEPGWLRWQNQDLWPQHAWRLGDLRQRAGVLRGDLAQRLLALVLTHLERDLRVERRSNRPLCERQSGHFWAEHEARYLAVALRVANDVGDDEPTLLYVCQYLTYGLQTYGQAIELLEAALERGQLSDGGLEVLVGYLQHEKRYAESIPHLEALLTRHPERVDWIALIMRAAHQTKNAKLTRAWFETGWAMVNAKHAENPDAHAQLGHACLEVGFSKEAIQCMDSAINLHTRTRPNRGVGDGTLSTYYSILAQTWAQLGDTVKAVDAACGAIVSWGSNRLQRQQQLSVLNQILQGSQDLPAYQRHLDAEVEQTGLENPLLRKALGMAYSSKGDLPRAEVQLRLSLEVQPHDDETHQQLVQVLDQAGRRAEATVALIALARGGGADSDVWLQVGQRYEQAGDAANAERAYTTLVELRPNESASHQALAEVRQRQRRLDDAALHWRQVIRVRTDEPTGWLGLARVLLQQGKTAEARETLGHLRKTTWPEHFGDVQGQVRQLEQKLR